MAETPSSQPKPEGGGEPGGSSEYSGRTETEDLTALAMNSDMQPGSDAPETSLAIAQEPASQAAGRPAVPEPAILAGDWVGLGKGVFQVEELLGTKVVRQNLGGNRVTKNILQVVKDKLFVIPSPDRSAG